MSVMKKNPISFVYMRFFFFKMRFKTLSTYLLPMLCCLLICMSFSPTKYRMDKIGRWHKYVRTWI